MIDARPRRAAIQMSLSQGLLSAAGLTGLLAGLLLAGDSHCARVRRVQANVCGVASALRAKLAANNRRNLRSSMRRARACSSSTTRAVCVTRIPAAVAMLGYEPRELNGVDYRVLLNMREDGRTDAVRQVRYTTNILGGVGALLRRKNGQTRPVEYKIVPVIEEGVSLGTVLVFRDMNERVRLDNLLQEMQTTARIGGWEYDVPAKTGLLDRGRSTRCYDLAAGSVDRIESTIAQYFAPAEFEKLRSAADNFDRYRRLRGPALAGVQRARQEAVGAGHHEGGKAQRSGSRALHGTVQDVTDLVNAERQLRETRDFFELTLNAAPMPIAYVSQEGNVRVVTYANKAMEAWLGRTRAEMIGKLSRDVFSADSIAIVQPRFDKLEQGETVQVRLQRHARRRGARLAELFRSTASAPIARFSDSS